jgi:sugar porter (SP) family MFS transporter
MSLPSIPAGERELDCPIRFNRQYIYAVSLVAALGGLLFGYDWVVIGGAEMFYEKYFHLTSPLVVGWVMSSALAGALVGSSFAGSLSDRFGRRPLLLSSGLLFVLTSLGTGLAPNLDFFLVNRLMGGVAIGIASSISPMYIAEIAPAEMRGRLVSMNQLTIAIGIVSAQVVNWLIARPMPAGITIGLIPVSSWNVQMAWRWMFGVTAIPALVFFVSMNLVPESPRFLTRNGGRKEALKILTAIGGAPYAERSIVEIEATLKSDADRTELRELFSPKILRIILLGVILAVFQQWCGINVIYQYGSRIFAEAGYAVSGILFNIFITGLISVVMTFVAIGTVDRWGRRSLMLSGALGLAVIYVATGWAFRAHVTGLIPVILVISAIACYCYSLAPITWVILAEIFPNRVRGAAMSISVAALWIANFLLAQTFPPMVERLGLARCFWIYAAICFAGFLFLVRRLPETKGKTLEELESALVR